MCSLLNSCELTLSVGQRARQESMMFPVRGSQRSARVRCLHGERQWLGGEGVGAALQWSFEAEAVRILSIETFGKRDCLKLEKLQRKLNLIILVGGIRGLCTC